MFYTVDQLFFFFFLFFEGGGGSYAYSWLSVYDFCDTSFACVVFVVEGVLMNSNKSMFVQRLLVHTAR